MKKAFLTFINRLLQKDLPFLLLLLIGMTSWCIIRLNDRLSIVPLVTYTVSSKPAPIGYEFTYRIKNITKDKVLDKVTFLIVQDYRDKSDSFFNAGIYYFPPTRTDNNPDKVECKPLSAEVSIPQIQPEAFFEIRLTKKTDDEIPLRFASPSAIYLSKPTKLTNLVENEVDILFWSAVIFILLIIIFYLTPRAWPQK